MSIKINSTEVLAYLNHLGYTNINSQQLKEFMQDLKKLIKYEERRREAGYINKDILQNPERMNEKYVDVFSTLYEHGTIASEAKVIRKKENIISVHIKTSKPQICWSEDNKERVNPSEDLLSRSDIHKINQEKINHIDIDQSQNIYHQSETLSYCDNKKMKINKTKPKPTSSFIRPSIPMTSKCDPVTLYHLYETEWKRRKLPGEDRRATLRWAIREKMLSGPKVF